MFLYSAGLSHVVFDLLLFMFRGRPSWCCLCKPQQPGSSQGPSRGAWSSASTCSTRGALFWLGTEVKMTIGSLGLPLSYPSSFVFFSSRSPILLDCSVLALATLISRTPGRYPSLPLALRSGQLPLPRRPFARPALLQCQVCAFPLDLV